MYFKPTPDIQPTFFFSLADTLDQQHPLFVLARVIEWEVFEEAFGKHYHPTFGRPCKPIRLMVGLLILKQVRNLSDESVVEQWSENTYYQHFCGNTQFTPCAPCEASELVHFRKRIGEAGAELILKESIRVNGEDAKETDVVVDTTVQEKNITYPTDAKLHRKIIATCAKIADVAQTDVRQSYTRTLKRLSLDQRFRTHPRNAVRCRKADRKVRTIAGRLVRELVRQLSPQSPWHTDLVLFQRVLSQKRGDTGKVYSLHEPEVLCIAKGKEHKKYEFGSKFSFVKTMTTNVIVGALDVRDAYDGNTLESALAQSQRLTGVRAKRATGDRGYRGPKEIGGTTIQIPGAFKNGVTGYQQRRLRHAFRRRAAIEPVIGHTKSDHRLGRNFLKGVVGDAINGMLSAAAFNFKRMMNTWKRRASLFVHIFLRLFSSRFSCRYAHAA
jgi:IS5 family transposase